MDHLTSILRSENMAKIRSENTSPEFTARKFLSSKGLRFRLHDKSLPGKPDIVFKSQKFAIFINGCFWHQHKGCKRSTIPQSNQDYWIPKLERNIRKQEKDFRLLKKMDWRVKVIWECKVNKPESFVKILSNL